MRGVTDLMYSEKKWEHDCLNKPKKLYDKKRKLS